MSMVLQPRVFYLRVRPLSQLESQYAPKARPTVCRYAQNLRRRSSQTPVVSCNAKTSVPSHLPQITCARALTYHLQPPTQPKDGHQHHAGALDTAADSRPGIGDWRACRYSRVGGRVGVVGSGGCGILLRGIGRVSDCR